MTPLTFICWRWKPPVGYRSKFGPETVTALRNMVARHYQQPHRFICIDEAPHEIDKDIETFPLWNDYADIPNPNNRRNPSCYRRLKAFAPEAREWFGERIVSIDLDTVIVSDIAPLFDRDEDFVIWGQSDFPKTQFYNGGLWMLKTGTRTKVWTEFNPTLSPFQAKRAGKRGSDQGWFSYILGPNEAVWGQKDGVYSYRVHIAQNNNELPADARVVSWHGHRDPWDYYSQSIPWVRQHYGVGPKVAAA